MKAEPPNDDPQLHGQLVTVNDTRDQGPGNTADINLDSHK